MSGLSALFVCDGSPSVGGGHVMRSLTLARALGERGWRSTFLASPFVAGLLNTYDPLKCSRIAVGDQRPETLVAAAAGRQFSAAVVDHFAFDHSLEATLRATAPVLAAIDDLPDRERDLDLVIDPNLERTSTDWSLAAGADLCLGPEYALVRAAFARWRPAVLARLGQPVRRVAMALGLTDVGGVTLRVVEALLPALGELRGLGVILGSTAPSAEALEALAKTDRRISLYRDVRDMPGLLSSADLMIGAGGSSNWERATMGLPTIAMILAANQRAGTEALARAGATVAVDVEVEGWEERLRAGFTRLCDDAAARTSLGRAAAALCDGQGAQRVAERLTARVQAAGRS